MGLLYFNFDLFGMANEPVMFDNSTEHRLSTTKEEIRSHEGSVTIPVSWNMTSCRLMGEHQNFRGVCCFFLFPDSPRINLDDHKNRDPSFFHTGCFLRDNVTAFICQEMKKCTGAAVKTSVFANPSYFVH
jgi:hypothetical protein